MSLGEHSAVPPHSPVTGAAVWDGDATASRRDWLVRLTAAHLSEIAAAVQHSRGRGLALMDMGQEDFPLPGLGPVLERLRHDILEGRGFVLIRGLPVEELDPTERAHAFWGIGSWLGEAVSQNARGHLLGHIIDLRLEAQGEQRIYQTSGEQAFHSDSCDIVGLLSLRKAKQGGESRIASAGLLHNLLAETRPDLLEALYGTFYCDHWGEVPVGEAAFYPAQVFSRHEGTLTCCGMTPDILSAQRLAGVPPLSALQKDALATLQDLAAAHSLEMHLETGDMQFLHNHTILHARAAYADHADARQRRHLLRLWLSAPQGRPLPAFLAARWGNVEVGARRGGIITPGTQLSTPLEP